MKTVNSQWGGGGLDNSVALMYGTIILYMLLELLLWLRMIDIHQGEHIQCFITEISASSKPSETMDWLKCSGFAP